MLSLCLHGVFLGPPVSSNSPENTRLYWLKTLNCHLVWSMSVNAVCVRCDGPVTCPGCIKEKRQGDISSLCGGNIWNLMVVLWWKSVVGEKVTKRGTVTKQETQIAVMIISLGERTVTANRCSGFWVNRRDSYCCKSLRQCWRIQSITEYTGNL